MEASGPAAEYRPITIVDIMRVLHGRRIAFGVVLGVAVLAGAAVTLFEVPQYEAHASIIPLSHAHIIESWLESRQGAESVVESMGDALPPVLFPADWDAGSRRWKGEPPSRGQIATALQGHVTVDRQPGEQGSIIVTARFSDPGVAAEVAGRYVDSLEALRPHLENLTRGELFEKYYDGTNAQAAQQRAETSAREQSYWLVFDSPTVPSSPVSPRPLANLAIAAIMGIVLGFILVFLLEWLSRYRADFQRVELPPR